MNIWRLVRTTDSSLRDKLRYMCVIEISGEKEFIVHFNDRMFLLEDCFTEREFRKLIIYTKEDTYEFEFQYIECEVNSLVMCGFDQNLSGDKYI